MHTVAPGEDENDPEEHGVQPDEEGAEENEPEGHAIQAEDDEAE